MLSKLRHYRHLIPNARVFTFVTINQVGFMLHAFMHFKSIFHAGCVITLVANQHCFLQLFGISIEVRSQRNLFDTYILVSVTFLLFSVLCQSHPHGSCVSFLEHLYSNSSHWNSWSFSFFCWTFITSEQMYFHFFFLVSLYSHSVHSCQSSVSISTFTWSYNKVPTSNKGSTILTGILGVG